MHEANVKSKKWLQAKERGRETGGGERGERMWSMMYAQDVSGISQEVSVQARSMRIHRKRVSFHTHTPTHHTHTHHTHTPHPPTPHTHTPTHPHTHTHPPTHTQSCLPCTFTQLQNIGCHCNIHCTRALHIQHWSIVD